MLFILVRCGEIELGIGKDLDVVIYFANMKCFFLLLLFKKKSSLNTAADWWEAGGNDE